MLSQKNFQINGTQPDTNIPGQYLDMIQIPYWDGNSNHPYPSVTVRMDFRGPDIGDFVYHCHILGHEDNGMMAIIRVNPPYAKNGAPASYGSVHKPAMHDAGSTTVVATSDSSSDSALEKAKAMNMSGMKMK